MIAWLALGGLALNVVIRLPVRIRTARNERFERRLRMGADERVIPRAFDEDPEREQPIGSADD